MTSCDDKQSTDGKAMRANRWDAGLIVFLLLCTPAATGIFALLGSQSSKSEQATPSPPAPPLVQPDPITPVRPIPATFARNSSMPDEKEAIVSGLPDANIFSPGRDLVFVTDRRVIWESDSDSNDTEDDHTMHKNAELPFRRLVELVCKEEGTLKVQDAYRPLGKHSSRSLHKEGRALDLTCDELGLQRLAQLCWAAGFDWVFYEANSAQGAHVHVSVGR